MVLLLDDNFSKFQGISTKLDACDDIKEVWFGIANWQISSIFCPRHDHGKVLSIYVFINSVFVRTLFFLFCFK